MPTQLEFKLPWNETYLVVSRRFQCCNCGRKVNSEQGYYANDPQNQNSGVKVSSYQMIYICPKCNAPNAYDTYSSPLIGARGGREIQNLPDHLQSVYNEIRDHMSQGSFSSAVVSCQDLLKTIALSLGAEAKHDFIYYVQFLSRSGIVGLRMRKLFAKVVANAQPVGKGIAPTKQYAAETMLQLIEIILLTECEYSQVR